MAETRDEGAREDLSEEASPYRIEEMRRQGQVSQSRELTSLLALIAAASALWVSAPGMGEQLMTYFRASLEFPVLPRGDLLAPERLGETAWAFLRAVVAAAAPICAAGFVIGILGSFAQIGAIFSWDPVQPDLAKVNPLAGLQRLLSGRTLIEGTRITAKLVVLSAVVYFLVRARVLGSGETISLEPGALARTLMDVARAVFVGTIGVFVLFAGLDFGIQRWEFGKKVRLTKQEAKQENKEREGDPMIKARIRAIQREVARRRMIQAVKKATVVVTNPTHFAVALLYEKDMAAPKVVAKGADFLAQKIKATASEAGIPLVENVQLARALYKSVKVGQIIPRSLYQAVAEILAYVYKLRRR